MKPEDEHPMDPRDAAQKALRDFHDDMQVREEHQQATIAAKGQKQRLWRMMKWGLAVALLGILAYRVPVFIQSLGSDPKPLRRGTLRTDAITDQCIENLWKISKRIQENRPIGTDIQCPLSQQPFTVNRTDGDLIVRSPNPQRYGFKGIRVSRRRPVPEVVK